MGKVGFVVDCDRDCLNCGKCTAREFAILDRFSPIGAGYTPREGFGLAIDLGTTSVALALIDLTTGAVVARHSFMNPQRGLGADVITRIAAANAGKLDDLQGRITAALNDGVKALMNAKGVQTLADVVIAGHTAMTYLLLGLPCESLGAAPFRPAYALRDTYEGLPGIDCSVRVAPHISAFVGGDVTAGLLHVIGEGAPRFLLMDLGTNGEMALWDHGTLWVTSTAAGPAFEGAGLDGGASAVIEKLACLVREDAADETGRLLDAGKSPFTQKQIRDLQLAKSAVRTGTELLLETAGLAYDALDAVYLAGGVGQAIDADDAVTVGLLPSAGRVRAVGNASLGGAARMLLDPAKQEAAREMAARAREVSLAAHPRFQELFAEYMGF